MLWQDIIHHDLKNLALARRDAELASKASREEIDQFIVERFGELMEKYNSIDKETLDAECVRLRKEGEALLMQGLQEIIRGDI